MNCYGKTPQASFEALLVERVPIGARHENSRIFVSLLRHGSVMPTGRSRMLLQFGMFHRGTHGDSAIWEHRMALCMDRSKSVPRNPCRGRSLIGAQWTS